jgi:hypothetical protein
VLSIMRRLLVVLILLSACRRKHPPIEMPELTPPPAPAAPAPPTSETAPEGAPPPAPPAEAVRTAPPSDDEIRAQLDPLLPDIKRCVLAQRPFDAGVRLLLRVRIEPSGEPSGAEVVGAPGASTCITEAARKLLFSRWHGNATLFTVALSTDGEPIRGVAGRGDAGEIRSAPDGGR